MGPTVVLRSGSSRILGAAMVVGAVLAMATAVLDGPGALLRYAAPSVLFGLLGWAAFWQPHVEVSDGGVSLANTWRTIEVPWPALQEVEGRYGLKLRTAYGAFTAWAAGAPSGRDRLRRPQSEAAAVVDGRLEELRAAGFLDDPRLERPRPVVRWHVATLAAATALAVATVALPLLG
jgi:hypothetical protein